MLGARTGGLDTLNQKQDTATHATSNKTINKKGDILDLIALQMIKSEQDKKKKDLMLKMQR